MHSYNLQHNDKFSERNGGHLRQNRIMLAVLAALGNVSVAYAGPSPSPAPASPAAPVPAAAPTPAAAAVPAAPEVQFSASFLGGESQNLNLESYEKGNPVLAGEYRVDLFVNGFSVGRETVSFNVPAAGGQAQPCITPELATIAGVDLARLQTDGAQLAGCIDLPGLLPAATVAYDPSLLRLDLSIPQVALSNRPRDYVDPKLWDRGVTAFTLGYSFNASHNESRTSGRSESAYLGLNAGLNIGGWRIRNQSNVRWDNNGKAFQNVNTYAQHDVTRLKSQLTIGDTFTSGKFFDSTAFRGIQLATDERMRPDSVNGYAPIVRGTAESNAKVEIRQQGYVIYETTVAPGAFEISDLYPNGMGGDLEVTVIEADNRQKTFKVPYASVPQLLRPGIWNYSATVGQVRNDNLKGQAPTFVEGSYQRGINNWLTAYGGVQATDGGLYRSTVLGAAVNTPVGAVAFDVSSSRARVGRDGGNSSGYSARVTYNKNIPSTRTDFALAAYRYSSQGYLSLSDATQLNDVKPTAEDESPKYVGQHQRSRFQFTVSQRFTDNGGSLFFSGSRNAYWDDSAPVDLSYQAGWSSRLRNGNYSISASRSRLINGTYDSSIYLNYSIPLGRGSRRASPPQLSMTASKASQGYGMQASVSGSAGDRSQYNYGVSGNYSQRGSNSVSANAGWRAAYANLGGSFTYSEDSRSGSVSATGGLVIHGGGITFTPQLGDTIALVKAKGAAGARLSSDNISKVDKRGFVVTSNLMPYRMNEVNLDPKGSSLDVELDASRQQVAPRAGSVVLLEFGTKSGKATLLRASLEDGRPVPFGAVVRDDAGEEVGIVGQGGQVFIRSNNSSPASLHATWGKGNECSLQSLESQKSDVALIRSVCRQYQ